MIRLVLTAPNEIEHRLAFRDGVITIGRSDACHVKIDVPAASKEHGRIVATVGGALYQDLDSTNGSIVKRDGKDLRVGTAANLKMLRLEAGDVLIVAGYQLRLAAEGDEVLDAPDAPVTVMASRGDLDLAAVQDHLVGADPAIARRFLRFVRETHGITNEPRLLDTIDAFVFEAFPSATHQSLVVRDRSGEVVPLLTRSRFGDARQVLPSRTVITRVMDEGVAILFSRGGDELGTAESVMQQRIETAIAAPLSNQQGAFGALQIDIREPRAASFSNEDLDLLTAVAGHVALVLDNRRLHGEQRTALESTINALVHSLSWKDPETVEHSRRVRDISLVIGRALDLDERALDIVSMAAILHDLGKHGVRDELLFKPGKLTPEEYEEVSRHAAYTQEILDEIYYPEPLASVPQIAAWHHERVDGGGPHGVSGDDLPVEARIIGAADAFDAIFSDRPYQEGRPVDEVLRILRKGSGTHWDAEVIDTLADLAPEIVNLCYDRRQDPSCAERFPTDWNRRAPRDEESDQTTLAERDEGEEAA